MSSPAFCIMRASCTDGTEPWPPWYDAAILMFQREVAERIVAAPGGKSYGRLSVLAQWTCDVAIVLRIPPAAFVPPPKVWSAGVRLTPRDEQPDARAIAAALSPPARNSGRPARADREIESLDGEAAVVARHGLRAACT